MTEYFQTYPQMPQALTLTQFTTMLGNAVRRDPTLQGAWVVAELSDLRASGGHIYMELIEKDQRGATISRLRANIWANRAMDICRKFRAATGRDLSSGLKVMLYGGVTHHTLYGLSFNVVDIDPSYTMGDLERLRREILMQLSREGVADRNKSLSLPPAPQKIAVISAAGAAGYGDFINQISSTPEQFVFYPLLFEATLQGERTASSVIAALDRIEISLDFWDAVVIIRGGGSTSDLNGFDNLELARRVAAFPLPVIVGIGHERDRTVLDDIACIRCKTPTAVAAFLIDSMRVAWNQARELTDMVARFTSERINGDLRALSTYTHLIPAVACNRLEGSRLRLRNLMTSLPSAVFSQTSRTHSRLELLLSSLRSSGLNLINSQNIRLSEIGRRVSLSAQRPLETQNAKLKYLDDLVSVLSPENTLKRGYSITRCGGKAVTDASSLKSGDLLETVVKNGIVSSKVLK